MTAHRFAGRRAGHRQAALVRGAADPAGFVAHPKQHLGQPHLQIRGRDVDVLELAAATLRRVAEQATQLAGQAVPELTLTAPATWGPTKRTLLRRAATRAGLPQPHLVDTPVAAAGHLLATGGVVPAGAAILLCDFGAGRFEATVATRTPAGFEVLSTIDTTHAAGLALDTAVADHLATITTQLTPTQPTTPAADGVPVAVETPAMDGRAAGLDRAHAAIQALAGHPAVAVPADPAGMPVVLDRPTLDRLTRPATGTAHPRRHPRHPPLRRGAAARRRVAAAADPGHHHRLPGPRPRQPQPGPVRQSQLGRIRPGRPARRPRRRR